MSASTNYAGLSPDYVIVGRDYYRLHVTLGVLPALFQNIQDVVAAALSQMQDNGIATPVGSFQEAGEGESAVAVFDIVINDGWSGVGTAHVGDIVTFFEAAGLKVTEIESVDPSLTGDQQGELSRASAATTDSANTGPVNDIKNAVGGVLPKLQAIGVVFAIVLVIALGALIWYYLPKRSSRAE